MKEVEMICLMCPLGCKVIVHMDEDDRVTDMTGFTCKKGAHGVGQACTEAFVGSFILILALDFMLAVIFKAIYNTFWPVKILL